MSGISRVLPMQTGMVVSLKRTTQPDNSPLLTTVKAHLRIDYADENTLIQSYIDAAVRYVENMTRISLFTQAWTLSLEYLPGGNVIELPNGPVTGVTSFTTYDSDNNADATFADYYVDTGAGRLILKEGYSWPSSLRNRLAAVIVYATGYGATEASIPQNIKQAVLMLCDHWHVNRSEEIGTVSAQLGFAVQALINSEKVMRL